MEIVRIRFRQSGGFAGLVRGCEITGKQLTAAEQRALARHLASPKGGAADRSSGARDLLNYELEVQTDAGTTRLQFDEAGAPDDLAALIERLQSLSAPMRP